LINGFETALIVGAGDGLSASIARKLSAAVVKVALAARDRGKLAALCAKTGAEAFACDATQADEVARLFEAVEKRVGGRVMGNQVAEVILPAAVTALAHHGIEARGSEPRVLLRGLEHKGQIGVDQGGTLSAFSLGQTGLGEYPIDRAVVHA
jgi:NAD(P)-dependent dehydrogenase (short-subunit alcohol dehydrogenase family)